VIYELLDGTVVDTARQCSFEERNLLQKMMIHQHLGTEPERLRAMWAREGSPVWQGPRSLESPTPAVRVLLDLEKRLAGRG
jgi:hypothetical protein